MVFSRQAFWSGLPCPPPGGLPHPGIKAGSPALQADSLLTEPPGKPPLQLLGPRRTWGCLRWTGSYLSRLRGGNRGGGKKPLCGLETESLRLEEALSSSMHPSAGAVWCRQGEETEHWTGFRKRENWSKPEGELTESTERQWTSPRQDHLHNASTSNHTRPTGRTGLRLTFPWVVEHSSPVSLLEKRQSNPFLWRIKAASLECLPSTCKWADSKTPRGRWERILTPLHTLDVPVPSHKCSCILKWLQARPLPFRLLAQPAHSPTTLPSPGAQLTFWESLASHSGLGFLHGF